MIPKQLVCNLSTFTKESTMKVVRFQKFVRWIRNFWVSSLQEYKTDINPEALIIFFMYLICNVDSVDH